MNLLVFFVDLGSQGEDVHRVTTVKLANGAAELHTVKLVSNFTVFLTPVHSTQPGVAYHCQPHSHSFCYTLLFFPLLTHLQSIFLTLLCTSPDAFSHRLNTPIHHITSSHRFTTPLFVFSSPLFLIVLLFLPIPNFSFCTTCFFQLGYNFKYFCLKVRVERGMSWEKAVAMFQDHELPNEGFYLSRKVS